MSASPCRRRPCLPLPALPARLPRSVLPYLGAGYLMHGEYSSVYALPEQSLPVIKKPPVYPQSSTLPAEAESEGRFGMYTKNEMMQPLPHFDERELSPLTFEGGGFKSRIQGDGAGPRKIQGNKG